jgi:hypothetical protein
MIGASSINQASGIISEFTVARLQVSEREAQAALLPRPGS